MGCASSKHRKRCLNCRGELSPVVVPRSYSMHVYHPAQHSGDSHHTVALTSSTIGSLRPCDSSVRHTHKHLEDIKDKPSESTDLQAKLIEAKVWSNMMNEKIPIVTPPGEPETINTWELMEGLEDVSPLRTPNHLRSFSFDVVPVQPSHHDDCPKSRFHENNVKSDSRFDDLDPPEMVSTFRKSLQQLPPDHPFHIRIPGIKTNPLLGLSDEEKEEKDPSCKSKSLRKQKVILYFTSLRGIRKTYEDSCNVRIILKGLGIRLDERDVSMHLGFRDELKELLRDKCNGVGITLPRVFLGNKYLGGVEEIKKFNENGTLEKLIQGCEKVEDCFTVCGNECEACGDVRFVPCETCSGSCKVYYEEAEEETEYGFVRCPDCNENGLIRCPVCCEHVL